MSKTKKKSHPEAKGLLLIGCALLLLLSLLSFRLHQPGGNWLGLVGYALGWMQTYLFGLGSYLILLFMGWVGFRLVGWQKVEHLPSKIFHFSLFLVSVALLFNLCAEHIPALADFFELRVPTESTIIQWPYPHKYTRCNLGGAPLYYLYKDLPTFNLQHLLSDMGIGLTFSITALASFLLLTEVKLLTAWEKMKKGASLLGALLKKAGEAAKREPSLEKKSPDQIEETLTKRYTKALLPAADEEIRIHGLSPEPPAVAEKKVRVTQTKREEAIAAQKVHNGDFSGYTLPPHSLLANPKKVDQPSLKKELRRQAEILEETLMSFGIEAKVGEIHCGPTIASFEVHPAVGVKVQKITALENDIALNLQAKSLRIIAPIPGKAAVGVEIPSLFPQEVSFKEMLQTYTQGTRKFSIPVLLGKSVSGESVMSDLTRMPHCIIAGATGSGKSVCINTIILSILMTARPDEVKLLLVDPKKVELTPYASLPHLIAPVITEPREALGALNWLVKEMLSRYDVLKQLGLRNMASFNDRKVDKEKEASLNIPVPEKFPFIVAIIDEFADLMMASSSDLETPIARIAQMARAVGIHLILATQRPSREVITGLIKANFPTRIAFKVASRINSQIILDETGADSLLGNGDMLFLPPGSSHLVRAQGAYVSDEEISRIVSFICDQAPPHYLIQTFEGISADSIPAAETGEGRDTLYKEALAIVVETQTASTTYLQRKLKIGYARAASLMDELETSGVIGPQEGSRPRRILINSANQDTYEPNDPTE